MFVLVQQSIGTLSEDKFERFRGAPFVRAVQQYSLCPPPRLVTAVAVIAPSLAKTRMVPEIKISSVMCQPLLVAANPVHSCKTRIESRDLIKQMVSSSVTMSLWILDSTLSSLHRLGAAAVLQVQKLRSLFEAYWSRLLFAIEKSSDFDPFSSSHWAIKWD